MVPPEAGVPASHKQPQLQRQQRNDATRPTLQQQHNATMLRRQQQQQQQTQQQRLQLQLHKCQRLVTEQQQHGHHELNGFGGQQALGRGGPPAGPPPEHQPRVLSGHGGLGANSFSQQNHHQHMLSSVGSDQYAHLFSRPAASAKNGIPQLAPAPAARPSTSAMELMAAQSACSAGSTTSLNTFWKQGENGGEFRQVSRPEGLAGHSGPGARTHNMGYSPTRWP